MDKDIIEFIERVSDFEIMTQDDRTALFNLHNRIYPKSMEHSKNCGSCRLRVYNKIKDCYNRIKNVTDQ